MVGEGTVAPSPSVTVVLLRGALCMPGSPMSRESGRGGSVLPVPVTSGAAAAGSLLPPISGRSGSLAEEGCDEETAGAGAVGGVSCRFSRTRATMSAATTAMRQAITLFTGISLLSYGETFPLEEQPLCSDCSGRGKSRRGRLKVLKKRVYRIRSPCETLSHLTKMASMRPPGSFYLSGEIYLRGHESAIW